ncbi:YoaK family protein [Streptococcus hongkongensis]|nr:membrane protein [Streptococcus uberis]
MSKRRRKNYYVHEGLRCAMTLTFISGFVNAFTFMTQGRRFAGVQSGNVVSFAMSLASGNISRALDFLLPIVVFMLGQSFTYFMHCWANKHNIHWYLFSSFILTVIAAVTAILTPFLPAFFTVSGLAFFASIQVDTFKSLRGAGYANVMMTGNVKNAAYQLTKGLFEGNKELILIGRNTLFVIISFIIGASTSTILSLKINELALIPVLLPLFYVNYLLRKEFNCIQSKVKPFQTGYSAE